VLDTRVLARTVPQSCWMRRGLTRPKQSRSRVTEGAELYLTTTVLILQL
jgi:hypothetical protein